MRNDKRLLLVFIHAYTAEDTLRSVLAQDVSDRVRVVREPRKLAPEAVIHRAGKTGRPHVDRWADAHRPHSMVSVRCSERRPPHRPESFRASAPALGRLRVPHLSWTVPRRAGAPVQESVLPVLRALPASAFPSDERCQR